MCEFKLPEFSKFFDSSYLTYKKDLQIDHANG